MMIYGEVYAYRMQFAVPGGTNKADVVGDSDDLILTLTGRWLKKNMGWDYLEVKELKTVFFFHC